MHISRFFKMGDLVNVYKSKFLHQNLQSITHTYEEAIEALNALQSSAEYLQKKKDLNQRPFEEYKSTIGQTQKYLARSGLMFENLDNLSVIHITGTKGKGSTSAYCESILRHHGYKTGFYLSPHLVEVRERIQIDGRPLEKNTFSNYFWQTYNTLLNNRDSMYDMPIYFRFLTVLAFNIFVKEKVDVAVIEVGIGGEYDCTNILRKVPVVGITSLGMDHMSLLGNTIEKIAWQKAGIMKNNSKAFTISQDPKAMKVLQERSAERNSTLEVVDINNKFVTNLPTMQHKLNASLAIALTKCWISVAGKKAISEKAIQQGIYKCFWPGRYQIIYAGNITYHIDGAHTVESMVTCSDWFKKKTALRSHAKVLIYNATGDRSSENLLKELYSCNFDCVYFVPNVATKAKTEDSINFNNPESSQLKRCATHKDIWLKILENNNHCKIPKVTVFPTVSHALENLSKDEKYDVLVTGSLHLVGAILSIIDPELTGNGM